MLVVLLAAHTACGRTGEGVVDGGAPSVLRRDSAGVVIVETPAEIARAAVGWTLGTAPDLQLGGADGSAPEQFYQIWSGGIRELSDGGIVVLDEGSAELRYFDADGRFLRRAGGRGDGPGEFQRPRLVPYSDPDSLLVHDVPRFRFTLISVDGTPGRSFGLAGQGAGGRFAGTPQGGTRDGLLIAAAFSTASRLPTGPDRNPAGVRLIHIGSTRVDTLARSEVRYYYEREVFPGVVRMNVPFSTLPSATVTPRGFAVTRGMGPEIFEYDATSRLARILRIDEPARSVTRADIEAALASEADGRGVTVEQLRRPFDEMDVPTEWPAFGRLMVDALGWIWAKEYRTLYDRTSRWVVFDPDGVGHGTVELPSDLEVQHIGADHVLGTWRDALGVEYVRRYRLERRP